jgi:uncharacterized RDD family membrane protein YckC
VGQALGRYVLVRRLGRGGFGEVWEAENGETGRRSALKLLRVARSASHEALERFEREGRLAASLNHPRCVFVFGAERVDGYPAIDMELMAGGTLQDVVARDGPLPWRRAIDAILDVIDGLDAAQQAGILHRDVKPSNCFLGDDGRVKIGDFGLSKTLEEPTLLSTSGGFIGTPSYASPEQVRGAEMDVGADIYSVGATLYALLAGRPPFRGRSATEVLAHILADEPPRLREAGVNVPASLERIVRRTLAKNPQRRYRSYSDLRQALRPFSSQALTTAGLARRVTAFLVDRLVVVAVLMAIVGRHRAYPDEIDTLAVILYFGLSEGLWGQTLGKRLFGLQVTTRDDQPPGLRRAFLRVVIDCAFGGLEALLAFLFPSYRLPLFYLLFATMRRENGYSGVHEVLTGTWVRQLSGRPEVSVPRLTLAATTTPASPRRFGPYVEGHVIWETSSESLIEAWDPALRRAVWVHTFGAELVVPSPLELAILSPHRLRWLQGTRTDGGGWDAYEAPAGTTLRAWIESRGTLSWAELRGVLAGAAAAAASAEIPLSIDHLWIDVTGTAKGLDFPTRLNAEPAAAATGWRAFLLHVARLSLESHDEDPTAMKPPHVPLPESARRLLARLAGDEPAFESPAQFAAALAERAGDRTQVSRRQRLATLAGPLFAVGMGLLLAVPLWFLDFSTRLHREQHDDLEQVWAASREADAVRREARLKLISRRWTQANENFRGFGVLPSVDEAVRLYPNVTWLEAQRARRLLGLPIELPGEYALGPILRALAYATFPLAFIAPAGLALAAFLRGGLAFSMMDVAVQRSDGMPAGRWRCLARASVAWGPALVMAWWLGVLRYPLALLERETALRSIHAVVDGPSLLAAAPGLLMIAGAVIALWRPDRGLPDAIAGTHLVPR